MSSELNTPEIVDALAQVTFTVHDLLTRTAAEHQLSATQLRLMGILRDRTPTMAQIAGILKLDRSSVTGLIDRAVARGLVARATSEHDARVVTVSLTDAGVLLGVAVAAAVSAELSALVAGVSAEDRQGILRLATSLN